MRTFPGIPSITLFHKSVILPKKIEIYSVKGNELGRILLFCSRSKKLVETRIFCLLVKRLTLLILCLAVENNLAFAFKKG